MALIKAPIKDEEGKNTGEFVEQEMPLFDAGLQELVETLGEDYVVGAVRAKMRPSADTFIAKLEKDGVPQDERDRRAAEWHPSTRSRRDPVDRAYDDIMKWPEDRRNAFLKRIRSANKQQRGAQEEAAA